MAGTSGTSTKTARVIKARSTPAATGKPRRTERSAKQDLPSAPTGGEHSVVEAIKRDLAALPDDLAQSALAFGALAVARVMDDLETDPTQMASCYRALQAGLERLRKLAPPKETNDGVDQLAAKRAQRRSRSATT